MRGTLKAILAASMLVASAATLPAYAVTAAGMAELSATYNDETDAEFRRGLQMRLAWAGDYRGRFDGNVGAQTLRAVRDFQARNGLVADGILSAAFLDRLVETSDAALASVGFDWHDDAETGVRLGLPLGLVSPVGRTEVGSMWRSADGAIEVETVRFVEEGYDLPGVFEILREETAGKSVATADFLGDHFILTGRENGRDFYIRFDGEGGDLRGFSVAYTSDRASALAPYIAVASNSFEPYAVPAEGVNGPLAGLKHDERLALAFSNPGALAMRSTPDGEEPGAAPGFDASGTGFVVADGWLLTNAHVANSCASVMVGDVGIASDVVVDEENDLALIRMEADLGEPLPIVTDKPRLGEDILALGFPLRSILADSLNVTRGNISSLLGLMNDPNYLQISAAVQPGNSGGPVIDLAGRVVGVVTAKLNAVAVADLTGDIPQSINFAIRPDAAARFLEANGIDYEEADASAELESVPDATARVQDSILPIICLGNS